MFGISAMTMAAASLATIAAGTVYSGYQANKSKQNQRSANNAAAATAKKQASLADQANNRANSRSPDLGSLFSGNSMPGGVSSTMLTGSKGLDQSKLLLGRNTLLGG